MRKIHHQRAGRQAAWGGLTIVVTLLAGCNSHQQPVYQGKQGFRFSPPPGWVERARDDALPVKAGQKQPDIPLPPLGVPGSSVQERLLVRYDRLTAGHLAWIRVTAADLPSSTSIKDCASARSPGPDWKRESEEESLEVSGEAAARVAFVGQWNNQEYASESVAVRHGEQVYFITASFPASDSKAREQVRQAVARATWK
jgi:hypothetical protein